MLPSLALKDPTALQGDFLVCLQVALFLTSLHAYKVLTVARNAYSANYCATPWSSLFFSKLHAVKWVLLLQVLTPFIHNCSR